MENTPVDASSVNSVDTPNQVSQNPSEAIVEANKPQIDPFKGTKHKVKVDGQELELDYDELLRHASKASAADKRFQEASQLRKQAEQFINQLRDPKQALKVLSDPSLGHDIRTLAEEYLVEIMEAEMAEAAMDPREKELRDYKAKLAKYEAEEKAKQAEKEAEEERQLQEKFTQDYNRQIVEAIEQSGLPRTEFTVKRLAHYMTIALQQGLDLTAMDVVENVKEDYMKEQRQLFGALDGDLLLKFLGEDVANKIRKHDLAKVKPVIAPSKPYIANPENKESSSKSKSKKTRDEVLAEIRNRYESME